MTVTVEIRPEVEAELARQATVHGHAIEAYLASLIEQVVDLPAVRQNRNEGKSLVEVCAMVRGLTDDLDSSRNPSTGRPVDLS